MIVIEFPRTGKLDYIELIRGSLFDGARRRRAYAIFRDTVNAGLLLHDEGNHPRISDVGRCSLEFATFVRGMHDLQERPADVQLLLLDQGTLSGAWNAALLAAALPPNVVQLEPLLVYQDVPGHADALVNYTDTEVEPVEFKMSQSGGQLRNPKEAGKLYQIVQAGMYASALQDRGLQADTFVIVTAGPNVGNNKEGVPYPKIRQDRFDVSEFRNEIDGEILRLKALGALDKPDDPLPPADAKEDFRCASCAYSACERNRNPFRLLL